MDINEIIEMNKKIKNNLNLFKKYLKKQSFQPNILSIFLNPFFLIRLSLYKKIKDLSKHINGQIIDFGCGRKPYMNLFNVKKYIGVDVEISGHDHLNSQIDVFYDGKNIPFDNNSFDSIICFEVLEHIFNPDEILIELNRILKNNGKALFSIPFCWNEHEIPYDYARYSSFGIKHLMEKNGFRVLEIHKTGKFSTVIIQLIILWIFEKFKALGLFGLILCLFLAIPFNVLGLLLNFMPSKNPSMYFNTVLLVQKNN
jgi:SAM-dependent methyltransferase